MIDTDVASASNTPLKYCECGCGTQISPIDKYGRPHRFAPGHNMKTPDMRAAMINNTRCLGHKHSEESKLKISESRKGMKFSDEHRQNLSDAKKGKYTGKDHPMYGKHPTKETRHKLSESHKGIKQSIESIEKRIRRGEDHYNWQGGITPDTRKRAKGILWRRIADSIRERDNNTCQICGAEGNGKKLAVHHIIPFRICKSHELDNLTTVCLSCHIKLDKKYNDDHKY